MFSGSLLYLFPPAGSLLVSFMQDRFGHRFCMLLSSCVQIFTLGTLLLPSSPNLLYVVSTLLGFNMGIVTGFSVSYGGEICDPKLRGTLTSVSNLFYFGGSMLVTGLYAITGDWKLSILCTVVVPLLSVLVTLVLVSTSRFFISYEYLFLF